MTSGRVDARAQAPLLDRLRKRIHRHGKRDTAAQLVKKETGKELTADALMRHL
jgi:Zn-dependent M32 family carboxypeptidase